MAAKRPPGTPGKIICWFRNFLVGRSVAASPWLRTTDVCSTRSPDLPNLPNGPAHQLAFNYYYSRDLRRTVQLPSIASSPKMLAETNESSQSGDSSPLSMPPTPGVGHQWTQQQIDT